MFAFGEYFGIAMFTIVSTVLSTPLYFFLYMSNTKLKKKEKNVLRFCVFVSNVVCH